ncbi:MAG: hypothetical protein ABI723_26640 [Bacteroidia bacterium]
MKKKLSILFAAALLIVTFTHAQYYEYAHSHSYGFMDEYPTRIKGIVVDTLGRFIVAGDYQRNQFENNRSFITFPEGVITLITQSLFC